MKYISVDYIVDICQVNITMLKAHHQSVAVSALRRVMEAVKEDCVEAEPVKHGKWKHVAGMNSKCSVCSHYFPVTEFDSRPFDINYCPNCGTRMDEKERENDDKM